MYNIDDFLPPWSDEDFSSLLEMVLSDPTLAGSPVFSNPSDQGSSNPNQNVGVGTEEGNSDSRGDDFLIALEGHLKTFESSGGGSPLASSLLLPADGTSSLLSTEPADAWKFSLKNLDQLPASLAVPDSASSRSSSPAQSLITPTHPNDLYQPSSFAPTMSVNESKAVNPSAWMSGVLAFDCDGAEWEGFDEKLQPGGEWDFARMLKLDEGGLEASCADFSDICHA